MDVEIDFTNHLKFELPPRIKFSVLQQLKNNEKLYKVIQNAVSRALTCK